MDELYSGTNVNTGNIIFNGCIKLGGSTKVEGDINGGSSLEIGTSNILNGNIITGKSVEIGGSTRLNGNLDADGNVKLGTSIKIYGYLTTSGTLTKSRNSIIYGNLTENGTPLAPQSYNSITLPTATDFNSGGQNISSNCSLSPGSYGNVKLGTSRTLTLSSGDYYFRSFSMGGSGKLKLNVNDGKIRIFITGDVTFGTSVEVTVLNGGPENIYLETKGDFKLGGSSEWNGIVYCPCGDITLGTSCYVKGALWAKGEIKIGGSSKIYYTNGSMYKGSASPENSAAIVKTIPNEFALDQNYPNPFNPTTTINYQLPEKNFVSIKVYDILGNLVTTLVDQDMDAGYHNITWNASNIASGVYFYRIMSGNFVSTKKLILMK